MRKDLTSYTAHNKDYKTVFNLENSIKRIEEYDKENSFQRLGFQSIVEKVSKKITTHIDVGCGTGWLVRKTSPYFKNVIGIEPSSDAIESARKITKNLRNITFINKDMIDGFEELRPAEPVFITTATVLTHIKDFYVRDFLHILNTLPMKSALYFDEPYGKNIQQRLWHVRSKEWWARNLRDWDITFLDNKNTIYTNGIYAEKVGSNNVKNLYKTRIIEKITWFTDGIINKIKGLYRVMRRMFLK